ncbi:MAG: universal stress protein [Thermoleophilia bacterium]|nr:universal stress protein [Thermoleophilia bacterium]
MLAATGGKQIESEGAWAARVDKWTPGHPVVNLLDQSLHANLVILGSRGLHGLRALGSVSERVAHRAYCSVLVVRVGVEPNELAGEPAEATTQRKDTDER